VLSLPGLTRQSIADQKAIQFLLDARLKAGHDEKQPPGIYA